MLTTEECSEMNVGTETKTRKQRRRVFVRTHTFDFDNATAIATPTHPRRRLSRLSWKSSVPHIDHRAKFSCSYSVSVYAMGLSVGVTWLSLR